MTRTLEGESASPGMTLRWVSFLNFYLANQLTDRGSHWLRPPSSATWGWSRSCLSSTRFGSRTRSSTLTLRWSTREQVGCSSFKLGCVRTAHLFFLLTSSAPSLTSLPSLFDLAAIACDIKRLQSSRYEIGLHLKTASEHDLTYLSLARHHFLFSRVVRLADPSFLS